VGGFLADLALGELAGDCFVVGCAGVGCAGDSHGLVDVGASGKGVANAAAEAGGGSAERFDFGGVIVGLVFELDQPLFVTAFGGVGSWRLGVFWLGFRALGIGTEAESLCYGGDFDDDGGGVDFVGDFDVVEFAGFAELLHAHEGDVHEGDGALGVGTVDFVAGGEVSFVGVLDDLGAFVEGDLGNLRHEGGVAAVIRPIGVEHAELGDGGLAVLALEIFLGVDEVGAGHGEAELASVGVEIGF